VSFVDIIFSSFLSFRKDDVFQKLKKNIKAPGTTEKFEISENGLCANASSPSFSATVTSDPAKEILPSDTYKNKENASALSPADNHEEKQDYSAHPMVVELSSRGLTSSGAKRKLQAKVREELTRTLLPPSSPSAVATASLSPSSASSSSAILSNAGKQALGI
jgi:hypothetical protein